MVYAHRPLMDRSTVKTPSPRMSGGYWHGGAVSRTPSCLTEGWRKPPIGALFMKLLSFKRHRFPAEVIRHAVWLYFRFSLSLRDLEDRPVPREQSGRKLPPSDPTTRATAAGLQIPGFRPEIPHHPCRDLQHLQRPASSDQPTDPSLLSCRGRRGVGGGRRCCQSNANLSPLKAAASG